MHHLMSHLNNMERVRAAIQVIKTALSAGMAWELAILITHNDYPYFAPLASVLVGQVTIADSLQKGINRTIGVIGGVLVSMFIGHWIPLNALSVFLVVLMGMALSTTLHMNAQITSQVGVSSLLVLAFGQEEAYIMGRIIETILGSAVAIGVNAIIVPPNEVPTAEKQILKLSLELAAMLKKLGYLYEKNGDPSEALVETRKLASKMEAASQSLKLAKESLRYSPFYFKRREKLKHLILGMVRLERITIEVRGIARALCDLEDTLEFREGIVKITETTAKSIERFGEAVISPGRKMEQRLKDAIKKARIQQMLCLSGLNISKSIHIGSILTDLHRILNEVTLFIEQDCSFLENKGPGLSPREF